MTERWTCQRCFTSAEPTAVACPNCGIARQSEGVPEPGRYGWSRTIRWRVLVAIPWCALVIVGWAAVEPREQQGWLQVVGIPAIFVAIGYLVAPGRIGMALVAFLSLGVGFWALLAWVFGAEGFVGDVGLVATLATIGMALLASLATFIYLGLGWLVGTIVGFFLR